LAIVLSIYNKKLGMNINFCRNRWKFHLYYIKIWFDILYFFDRTIKKG
jgi:hypothetical protein